MSDDKPKPVEDLKEGLGLLFRAAKGAVESLPTDKIEGVAKDAAKEVGRAFESIGSEVDKLIHPNKTGTQPPQAAPPNASASAPNAGAPPAPEPPKEDVKYDDGYAPEPPPKGPRVG
ncbi:MAG: hypothetical protein U0270_37775 [Labilithrix sp.]